jgi:hypothetical protein
LPEESDPLPQRHLCNLTDVAPLGEGGEFKASFRLGLEHGGRE